MRGRIGDCRPYEGPAHQRGRPGAPSRTRGWVFSAPRKKGCTSLSIKGPGRTGISRITAGSGRALLSRFVISPIIAGGGSGTRRLATTPHPSGNTAECDGPDGVQQLRGADVETLLFPAPSRGLHVARRCDTVEIGKVRVLPVRGADEIELPWRSHVNVLARHRTASVRRPAATSLINGNGDAPWTQARFAQTGTMRGRRRCT